MSEGNEPGTPPVRNELDDLEPVRRDRGFLFRLVAALIVGTMAAAFVGWKMQSLAAGCGGGLVRPGSTVIPPGSSR